MAESKIKNTKEHVINRTWSSSETTKQIGILSTSGNVIIWFFGKKGGNFNNTPCYGMILANPTDNLCNVYNATANTISASYNGTNHVLTVTAGNNANITFVSVVGLYVIT